jgi:hypothetical protein
MSDTMTVTRSTSHTLGRQSGRFLGLAASLVLAVAIAAVAVIALAWPTDSSTPAREGTGATSPVVEHVDCWPGQPC